jgi:hypothetical protein
MTPPSPIRFSNRASLMVSCPILLLANARELNTNPFLFCNGQNPNTQHNWVLVGGSRILFFHILIYWEFHHPN